MWFAKVRQVAVHRLRTKKKKWLKFQFQENNDQIPMILSETYTWKFSYNIKASISVPPLMRQPFKWPSEFMGKRQEKSV